MSVQQFMAFRMPHKTLDGHHHNQLIFVWDDFLHRPRSFLEAGFRPLCPPFVYFVPLSRTKLAFWISTRTTPGPISQVLPSCRVRHTQYSKKLFVTWSSKNKTENDCENCPRLKRVSDWKNKHNSNFEKIVFFHGLTNYQSNLWRLKKVILNFL